MVLTQQISNFISWFWVNKLFLKNVQLSKKKFAALLKNQKMRNTPFSFIKPPPNFCFQKFCKQASFQICIYIYAYNIHTVNPPISPRRAYLKFQIWGEALLEAWVLLIEGGLIKRGGLIKFCRKATKNVHAFSVILQNI